MGNTLIVGLMILALLTACSMFGGGEQSGTAGGDELADGTGGTSGSAGGSSTGSGARTQTLQSCRNQCEMQAEEDKADCKDGCAIVEAVYSKDLSYCDNLEDQSLIANCYGQVAIAAKDPTMCDYLGGEEYDECSSMYDAVYSS